MPLKRKQVNLKVTTVGEPDICKLSESEQKAFYVSMLIRILDKRRQQLEEQSSVNAQKDNAVPRVSSLFGRQSLYRNTAYDKT